MMTNNPSEIEIDMRPFLIDKQENNELEISKLDMESSNLVTNCNENQNSILLGIEKFEKNK